MNGTPVSMPVLALGTPRKRVSVEHSSFELTRAGTPRLTFPTLKAQGFQLRKRVPGGGLCEKEGGAMPRRSLAWEIEWE